MHYSVLDEVIFECIDFERLIFAQTKIQFVFRQILLMERDREREKGEQQEVN